jgi:hypothetical protein
MKKIKKKYVGDITIPTKIIKYNKKILQADQPIRLQYANQIKLLKYTKVHIM